MATDWRCGAWGQRYRGVFFRRCYWAGQEYAQAQVRYTPAGWVARVRVPYTGLDVTSKPMADSRTAKRWAGHELGNAGMMRGEPRSTPARETWSPEDYERAYGPWAKRPRW